MAVGERKDPYLGFHFRVEIEGLVAGGFSEVSGLQAEVETEDFKEGGANGFTHKLRKPTKYPNLVLKRGLTNAASILRKASSRPTSGWIQAIVVSCYSGSTRSISKMIRRRVWLCSRSR